MTVGAWQCGRQRGSGGVAVWQCSVAVEAWQCGSGGRSFFFCVFFGLFLFLFLCVFLRIMLFFF